MILSKKQILLSLILIALIIRDRNFIFILNFIALIAFFSRAKVKKNIGVLILFLFIPILVSLAIGIFIYPKYDVFKDIYYLFIPITSLLIGILIAEKVDMKILLRTVIIIGSIFSLINIIQVFIVYGFGAFYDLRDVRYEIGGWHIISITSMLLCICSLYIYKLEIINSNLLTKLLIALNGLSFLFSGSRTFLVVSIIMVFSLIYPLYRFRIWLLIKSSVLIIGLLSILFYYNSENSLIKSILQSSTELAPDDYKNSSDMNNKYRGWETYRAFVTYIDGNLLQIILGHGAGKMIDLGTYFHVGASIKGAENNETVRYIPILHNGYLYLLVKTGILGLLCYLLYFYYLFRFAAQKIILNNIQKSFEPLFLIGILISLFISNIVISGLFNPEIELLGILCGSFIYYLSDSVNPELLDHSNG